MSKQLHPLAAGVKMQAAHDAQREAELALNASESHLAAIIDSAMDAIITIDEEQRVVLFNQFASRMFGCSRTDALMSPLTRFLPGDAQAVLDAARAGGPARVLTLSAFDASGREIPVEASVSRIVVNGRELISVIVRDITPRIESRKVRAALEAQLRESQKMEAMGAMASGIAHDFNNIVAAILGNAMLARTQLGAASPALGCIDEISRAGQRARELVQRIMDYTRRVPSTFAVQPLAPLLDEALGMLRATAPAGLHLASHLPDEPLQVHCDSTQITQVLMNLGANAAQACASGSGEISFTLSRHGADEALLQVTDNGCGMDDSVSAHIFEPFFTTKPKGQGTGLGLPVTHAIVAEHGGRIEVQSARGQGTTFSIFLPLAQPQQAQAPRKVPAPAVDTRGHGQHLVYLDDYPAMVCMMEATLQAHGYRVSGFEDARKALAFIRDNLDNIDLVVSDYNMPGACGLDVARTVARLRADLPVIVASGCLTPELESGARDAGVAALFEKPRGLDELQTLIAGLLKDRQHAGTHAS